MIATTYQISEVTPDILAVGYKAKESADALTELKKRLEIYAESNSLALRIQLAPPLSVTTASWPSLKERRDIQSDLTAFITPGDSSTLYLMHADVAKLSRDHAIQLAFSIVPNTAERRPCAALQDRGNLLVLMFSIEDYVAYVSAIRGFNTATRTIDLLGRFEIS